jgi:hypothetical protein
MNRRNFINRVVIGSFAAASGLPVLAANELSGLDKIGVRRLIVEIKRFVHQVLDGNESFTCKHYFIIKEYLDTLVYKKALVDYSCYSFVNYGEKPMTTFSIFIYPNVDTEYIELKFEMEKDLTLP